MGGRLCPSGKMHARNAKIFGEFGTSLGVYLKTPNAPGQRAF